MVISDVKLGVLVLVSRDRRSRRSLSLPRTGQVLRAGDGLVGGSGHRVEDAVDLGPGVEPEHFLLSG